MTKLRRRGEEHGLRCHLHSWKDGAALASILNETAAGLGLTPKKK